MIVQGDQLAVFLAIAQHHPQGISAREVQGIVKPPDPNHRCFVSHHIKGLRRDNIIQIARQGKTRGQKVYKLTNKGLNILASLHKRKKCRPLQTSA